ncbi:carbohydrate ABC transporter permease [Microbacterium sp. NPDC057650]|uniref:carbohydrate ABC transporter permease n=1 Tax=unclassified Microbacterium TaxID=2609290 RepID=UPI00366EE2FF
MIASTDSLNATRRVPAPLPANRPALHRRTFRNGRWVVLSYAFLLIWLLISVGPVLWGVFASFKTQGELFAPGFSLFPRTWTFANYDALFSGVPFWRWFLISMLFAVAVGALSTFLSAMVGYGFAKFRFAGSSVLFSIVLSALVIPFSLIMVPMFFEVSKMGLANNVLAYAIPFICPAFGVFMMRQFTVSVPSEMIEAARIDGASEWRIFIGVILPVVRPALAALFVWQFLAVYNDFVWPNIIVTNQELFTLPLGLNSLRNAYTTEYGLVLAGAALAAVPTIIIFISLRKQLIEGLTTGSVKG